VHATEVLVRRRRLVEDDGDDPDDGRLGAMVAPRWVAEGHGVLLSRVPLWGNGEVHQALRVTLASKLARGRSTVTL